jgi:aryl-alcohol dehydrogenase-like predicted oxidoreductase
VQVRSYGPSLAVSSLGLGAGQVGDASLSEAQAGQLLNAALDLGITLIDTARGYGLSEERIGRHLKHRRSEFVLSTKVGYGIEGLPDWTGETITAGVDAALQRLQTDVLDIVHLHSCGLDVLQRGDVVEALLRARERGKLRIAAYSGENEALAWAIASGHFGGVECSVNLFDQGSLSPLLEQAQQRGMGVIAKRPLGNAPWRFAERPVGDYAEVYWERMQALAIDRGGLPWDELALRFTLAQAPVSSAIAGTGSLAHLRRNAELAALGPLPGEQAQALRARFAEVGAGWRGEV